MVGLRCKTPCPNMLTENAFRHRNTFIQKILTATVNELFVPRAKVEKLF